jgi:hypothetical protein
MACHVVQLANRALAEVRRRSVATIRGRRGRASDPEYGIRRRLGSNLEDLRDGQLDDMFTRLETPGTAGEHVKCAYIVKVALRALLKLARTGGVEHEPPAQQPGGPGSPPGANVRRLSFNKLPCDCGRTRAVGQLRPPSARALW